MSATKSLCALAVLLCSTYAAPMPKTKAVGPEEEEILAEMGGIPGMPSKTKRPVSSYLKKPLPRPTLGKYAAMSHFARTNMSRTLRSYNMSRSRMSAPPEFDELDAMIYQRRPGGVAKRAAPSAHTAAMLAQAKARQAEMLAKYRAKMGAKGNLTRLMRVRSPPPPPVTAETHGEAMVKLHKVLAKKAATKPKVAKALGKAAKEAAANKKSAQRLPWVLILLGVLVVSLMGVMCGILYYLGKD